MFKVLYKIPENMKYKYFQNIGIQYDAVHKEWTIKIYNST